MSLLLALDPGASPSRPGCEARGCRSTFTTSVRAYLGRPHPTTLRVCERHRRDLEIAGDLENPVICCYPPCGRTRAPSSRLCAEHDAIIVAAKINIPRKGVISAETLVAIRKAVEAADLQKASTAAVASARPRMEEPAPDYLGACWEHLRDHVAGGTRIDMAVGEVVDLLKQTRKNLARREKDWESAVQIAELRGDEVRAASAALTALGVPMIQADPAEPQYDLVARIKRLAMRPTVQPEPVPADVLQPEAIGGQKLAADLIMEALNGRLAEMPAGVELSLQLALTGVVGLLASERGAVAQRDALAATVAAITATLDELRAPDGAQQPDGTIDTSEATRIRLLLAYWSDAIRSVLPGNAERATGERVEPLASLLRDIRAGLDAAQKDAQPAPPARPTQDERAPDYMGACWRHLADLVPGGTRIDVAVGEVTGKLRQARELLAEREKDYHAIVAIAERRGDEVRAASNALTALGVPMPEGGAESEYLLIDRINRLASRPTLAESLIATRTDPLRVQATPAEGFGIAIEWTLDTVEAPRAPTISDRITALAGQRDELRAHLDAIRKALNVGPPSDSDVQPGTSPERLTEIVRARTVRMLEERDQRVALAEEVEALKKTLGDPLAPAVDALVAWLSGPGGEQAHKGFKTGLLYALYRRAIEPMAAAEALGGLRALARLILSTPEPFDLPF